MFWVCFWFGGFSGTPILAPGGFVDWLVDIWHLVFGVVISGCGARRLCRVYLGGFLGCLCFFGLYNIRLLGLECYFGIW